MDRLRSGASPGTVLRETGAAMTGIREVGLIGAVGLVTCLVASLHTIPVGWRLRGRRGPPA